MVVDVTKVTFHNESDSRLAEGLEFTLCKNTFVHPIWLVSSNNFLQDSCANYCTWFFCYVVHLPPENYVVNQKSRLGLQPSLLLGFGLW